MYQFMDVRHCNKGFVFHYTWQTQRIVNFWTQIPVTPDVPVSSCLVFLWNSPFRVDSIFGSRKTMAFWFAPFKRNQEHSTLNNPIQKKRENTSRRLGRIISYNFGCICRCSVAVWLPIIVFLMLRRWHLNVGMFSSQSGIYPLCSLLVLRKISYW